MTKTVHAATWGRKRDATGTAGDPFGTVQEAVLAGGPGCIVRVLPGCYGYLQLGVEACGCVIEGVDPQYPPSFTGDKQTHGINVCGPSNDNGATHDVTLRNLEVAGAGYTGIKVHGNNHAIEGCFIHDVNCIGIEWHGAGPGHDLWHGLTVRDCRIERYGLADPSHQYHGVYLSGTGLRFERNRIRFGTGKNGYGIHLWPLIDRDCLVIDNEVTDCKAGFVMGCADYDHAAMLVGNRFCSDADGAGKIRVYDKDPETFCLVDPNDFGFGNVMTMT